MELYNKTSYAISRQLTLRYSSSFGMSSRLFDKSIQHHIFAIYGLVRIADEIVDTYRGSDALQRLDTLEAATYYAIETGFDTNPIVHAFAKTATLFSISHDLIRPFFVSMRMDLPSYGYTPTQYETYIYGSAEVVGLMCLKVFTKGDVSVYEDLQKGAGSLGAAYQKINFLRDIAADYKELGRVYFPNTDFESFNDATKQDIIEDIKADLSSAQLSLRKLPKSCRSAVMTSYVYYSELLRRLEITPADVIKTKRIRVPSHHKIRLLAQTVIREKVRT